MDYRGECVGVVSGKGGTGKTSFTAGAGAALAQLGQKVLCVDCDVGLRNLDLAVGLTDGVVMNFADAALGRCTLEDAVISHPRIPGLYLLNAPPGGGEPVTEDQMRALVRQIRKRFDFCLLDAPAGLGYGFRLATCAANHAVVIAGLDPPSLRDAQRTAMELEEISSVFLVVSRIRRRLLAHMRTTIDDAMDSAGLPLLGLVPEDEAVSLALVNGALVALSYPKSKAAAAYRNIALRLTGKRTDLLRIKW